MSTDKRLYIILGLVTLLGVLFIVLRYEYRNVVDKEWRANYKGDSKDPYGTWLFRESLKHRVNGSIINGMPSISDTTQGNELYVYVGNFASKSPKMFDSLSRWIDQGNIALIIASSLGPCYDTLAYRSYLYNQVIRGSADLYFTDTTMSDKKHIYKNYDLELDTGYTIKRLSVFSSWSEDDDSHEIKGYMGDRYRGIIHEKILDSGGSFVFITVPELVSNIGFQQPDVMAYIDTYLSTLPAPTKIYWDDTRGYIARGTPGENPLKYIMGERSLRLAYYMALLLGLLFIVFRSRRCNGSYHYKKKMKIHP